MHDSIRHRLCDLRLRLTRSLCRVWILSAIATLAPVLSAQTQPAGAAQQAPPAAAVQEHAQKPSPAQEAASTKPPAPDWPINAQPKPATIFWKKHELSIDAANSSLEQILTDVASATGASVDGVTKDESVFGTFGPAPARDVLAQLLQGTGYNVMMIGDQGQGLPRQIILSDTKHRQDAPGRRARSVRRERRRRGTGGPVRSTAAAAATSAGATTHATGIQPRHSGSDGHSSAARSAAARPATDQPAQSIIPRDGSGSAPDIAIRDVDAAVRTPSPQHRLSASRQVELRVISLRWSAGRKNGGG